MSRRGLGGKKGKEGKRKTLGAGEGEHRAALGSGARRGGQARSVLGPDSTAGRPSRLSRSLPPSLPPRAAGSPRPSAAPGKPAVLTARRAGRAGEAWKRRPRREPGLAPAWAPARPGQGGTPRRRPRVRPAALPGPSRESSRAHRPAHPTHPPIGGREGLCRCSPPSSLLTLTAVLRGPGLSAGASRRPSAEATSS